MAESSHPCTFGLEMHACDNDACTLTHLADTVCVVSQIFMDPGGHPTEMCQLSEAVARRLADLIMAIREEAWKYHHQEDEWHNMLGLLDLVEDLLRTQYRHAHGVQFNNVGTSGVAAMLHTVEGILRRCDNAVQSGRIAHRACGVARLAVHRRIPGNRAPPPRTCVQSFPLPIPGGFVAPRHRGVYVFLLTFHVYHVYHVAYIRVFGASAL